MSYDWDFGDGETRSVQTNRISHTYATVGAYTVTLKVVTADEMENEVEKMIFVGEKDAPIPAYFVTDAKQIIRGQNDSCPEIINGETVEHPAYRLERYEEYKIDPSDSVNAQGEKRNLSMYFQAKNDEIYKGTSYLGKFDEM